MTLEAEPSIRASGPIDIGGYVLKEEDLKVRLTGTQHPSSFEFATFSDWLGDRPIVASFSERPVSESYYVVAPGSMDRLKIRDEITGSGGKVVNESLDAFIVRMDGRAAERVGDLEEGGLVRWMGLYQPRFKITMSCSVFWLSRHRKIRCRHARSMQAVTRKPHAPKR